MNFTPHDERPEAVKILVDSMNIDISSKYPDWGSRMVSRRTPLGYMYDVVVPPTMEESMLPEELR